MLCANISKEVQVSRLSTASLGAIGAVDWSINKVPINHEGNLYTYNLLADSVTRNTTQELIGMRMKVCKKTPQGWALKVLANSLYGTFGAKTSPMYMRKCATTVTTIVRWLVSLTSTLVESVTQANVLYGDTDSVFI
ncbi:unnamed protein product, partial [Discosporangium mesarthrocarpum]